MKTQTASSFVMIRPTAFSYNQQTAATNIFQKAAIGTAQEIYGKAVAEFNHALHRMQKVKLNVLVFDQQDNQTPDAVFPNNWLSLHADGKAILYPMLTPNRRMERRTDVLQSIQQQFEINQIIDLTHYEQQNQFLEGTGSIVFDHDHKIAYACLSERTHLPVLLELCNIIGYQPHTFTATNDNLPIYHTNVVLHIGQKYAVLCAAAISDIKERKDLERILAFTGHQVVQITIAQMYAFAANMLQVQNADGNHYTLLSATAIRTLHFAQIETITKHSELIAFEIPTIEKIGGGSIRCMMAEVFCKQKEKMP